MRHKHTTRWITVLILLVSGVKAFVYGQINPFSPLPPLDKKGWNIQLQVRNLFQTDVFGSQTFINYHSRSFMYTFTHTGIMHPLASHHIWTGDIQIPLNLQLSAGVGGSRRDWIGDESQSTEWGLSWRLNWQPDTWQISTFGYALLGANQPSGGHSILQVNKVVNDLYSVQGGIFMEVGKPLQILMAAHFELSDDWGFTVNARYPQSLLGCSFLYSISHGQRVGLENFYELSLGHSPGVIWTLQQGNPP